jgi:hypothetical protein
VKARWQESARIKEAQVQEGKEARVREEDKKTKGPRTGRLKNLRAFQARSKR